MYATLFLLLSAAVGDDPVGDAIAATPAPPVAPLNADPNYHWHNNRWWYRTPEGWILWHEDRWIPYTPDTYHSYYPREGWIGYGYGPNYHRYGYRPYYSRGWVGPRYGDRGRWGRWP